MIVFCEDCGKKNILDTEEFKHGKGTFRCGFCNYLNIYHSLRLEKTFLEKAAVFLQETTSFSDIIGSFFFHRKNGVMKNNMPELLKGTDLDNLGKILTKNYLLARSLYKDVDEMTVVISNKNLVVKMLDPDLFIIIACKTLPLKQAFYDRFAELAADNAAQSV